MKNTLAYLCLTMLIALLSGCGTSPTPLYQAINVPSNRVYEKPPVQSSTPSSLTLIRDSGLMGIEHVFEFRVNGVLVTELESGEKLTIPVDPGTVIIEVRMFNVLGKIAPAQIETNFAAGRNYVYRAGLDDTPHLFLTRDTDLSR